jgi:probable rRNA maturation factor
MTSEVELQVAVTVPGVPDEADLRAWAETALADRGDPTELVIRIVDEAESAALNATYRHKQGPTNVLSFPFEPPPGVDVGDVDHLGDIVICAPVVMREAILQGKSPDAHWAHMVVHGILHLLGHDHQDDSHAAAMEALEVQLLSELGYPNPY